MLDLRDFHRLGWQALSVLQLRVKDKTKRNADKTEIDADTTNKKNLKERL
jgi:tRNA 2-selenouridine synthase SelU